VVSKLDVAEGFVSDGYLGMVGNLTATAWTAPDGSQPDRIELRSAAPPTSASLTPFRLGELVHHQIWTALLTFPILSDGKFIARRGAAAPPTFVIDLLGSLGMDQ
jgi:hypothetical protein